MTEDEKMRLLRKIGEDVSAIRRYARFQSMDAMLAALRDVAKTSERQQMWRLADGSLSNEQISNQIGVSLRAVQYFVQEAENLGLITMEKRGYPKRAEDLIPADWKP